MAGYVPASSESAVPSGQVRTRQGGQRPSHGPAAGAWKSQGEGLLPAARQVSLRPL